MQSMHVAFVCTLQILFVWSSLFLPMKVSFISPGKLIITTVRNPNENMQSQTQNMVADGVSAMVVACKKILPGKVLAYLETALKKKPDNPIASFVNYFNVAGGEAASRQAREKQGEAAVIPRCSRSSSVGLQLTIVTGEFVI